MKQLRSLFLLVLVISVSYCEDAKKENLEFVLEEIVEDKKLDELNESKEVVIPPVVVEKPVTTGKIERLQVTNYGNNYNSLTSRIQPPDEDNNQRSGAPPFVLTEQRLKEIRAQFMYWYFDQGGNENIGDYQSDIHAHSQKVHKNLNFQLPFFGFRFNYTRVSMNGYLEFSDPPEYFTSYPLTFPVKGWPKVNDPSFIGIFYSQTRIGYTRPEDSDQRKPGVYFRVVRDLQTRSDQFAVEVRERVKWDIREGAIGSESFEPKHVIITTWKNISFEGDNDNALYKTNTFQMVLATDEVFTYCIFNYLDIQWTTHRDAGGDTANGDGGIPAYVGFNAGNGTQSFEYTPYSQTSEIKYLTERECANGFKGRHIFRIDEKILTGTCNLDNDNLYYDL